jgi:substrate-binding family protein
MLKLDRRAFLVGVSCAGLGTFSRAFADPGVAADKITFGQAAVFEGPANALGIGMRDGILAAFGETNTKGGVKGRKLELVTRDDGYEPAKSIEATKALIEAGVFALVGPVGDADLGGGASHRQGGRRSLHRSVHWSRVAAHAPSSAHRQYSRLLFPGDRGDGGARQRLLYSAASAF